MSFPIKRLTHIFHTAIMLFITLILLSACKEEKKKVDGNGEPDFLLHQVLVEELYPAGKQLYVRTRENGNTLWLAIPELEVAEGDLLFFTGSGVTRKINYRNEELNMTFDTLYIVDQVTRQKGVVGDMPEKQPVSMKMPPGHAGGKIAPVKQNVSVTIAPGTLAIAGLYENKQRYAGKKVKVSGVVVKVNRNIMGRNWVHLQDGTSYHNSFDLTVTTQQEIEPGQTATFEGIIALNKDFTSGYFYEVIMESAVAVGTE